MGPRYLPGGTQWDHTAPLGGTEGSAAPHGIAMSLERVHERARGGIEQLHLASGR